MDTLRARAVARAACRSSASESAAPGGAYSSRVPSVPQGTRPERPPESRPLAPRRAGRARGRAAPSRLCPPSDSRVATVSRIASRPPSMPARSPAGDILRSCGQTLSAPPWRPLRPRSPRVGRPCPHRCDARRCSPGPRLVGQFATRLENTLADRVSTIAAAETLAGHVRSRPAAFLGAHGHEDIDARSASGGRSEPGASATSWPLPGAGAGLPGPGVHRSLQPGHVAPVPSRGNAPRNFSPNRTEADR